MNDRDAIRLLNEGMFQQTVEMIRRGHSIRAIFVVMTWFRDLIGHPYIPVDETTNGLCRLLRKI